MPFGHSVFNPDSYTWYYVLGYFWNLFSSTSNITKHLVKFVGLYLGITICALYSEFIRWNLKKKEKTFSSTGGWMVRALVFQGDGRVFESNQWLSFDFQMLSYLLRFKIRVSTLCTSFRTSHSWAYSPVTAVWSPSGQLAGCWLDYGCGRRRTMSIPVRLRAAILGAKTQLLLQ